MQLSNNHTSTPKIILSFSNEFYAAVYLFTAGAEDLLYFDEDQTFYKKIIL